MGLPEAQGDCPIFCVSGVVVNGQPAFEYTTIEMAHRMGIDLEPYASTDRVDNIRIVNNSICGNYGPIADYAHWGVTNVVIPSDTYCWGGPIAF